MTEKGCPVHVQSVLRLRPLLPKEREDQILLFPEKQSGKNTPAAAILNPLNGTLGSPKSPNGYRTPQSSEYHFNHVLPAETSQDTLYFKLGLPIATSAMDSLKLAVSNGFKESPRSHLLICMGVSSSGKTYTCYGGSTIPKRRSPQDGLVPRLLDSFFSQSKHSARGSSKQFSVQISIVQVTQTKGKDPHACQIHDLLAPASKDKAASPPKRNMSVLAMVKSFERPSIPSPIRSPLKFGNNGFAELDAEDIHPVVKNCQDVTEARELLQAGLAASKKLSKGNRTHHLMTTIRPVIDGKFLGDRIAVLDMAGLEKGKRSQNRGKDSMPRVNQATNASVLHCLRTLLHNTKIQYGAKSSLDVVCADDEASEISCVSQERRPYQTDRLKTVPFRQHKLTMTMKSLFTSSSSANITLLLAAYPGHADYSEKKTLLQDMELLCGADLLSLDAKAMTGFEEKEEESMLDDTSVTDDESASLEFSTRRVKDSPPNSKPDPFMSSKMLAKTKNGTQENETIVMPPPFAPKSRREPPKAYSRWLARPPTAPPEVIHSPSPAKVPNSEKRLHSSSADFPGVSIPEKLTENRPLIERPKTAHSPLPPKSVESSPIVERLKMAEIRPASIVGGPKAKAPPSPDELSWVSRTTGKTESSRRNQSRRSSTDKRPLQPSSAVNIESPTKVHRGNQIRKVKLSQDKSSTPYVNSPDELSKEDVKPRVLLNNRSMPIENSRSRKAIDKPSSRVYRGATTKIPDEARHSIPSKAAKETRSPTLTNVEHHGKPASPNGEEFGCTQSGRAGTTTPTKQKGSLAASSSKPVTKMRGEGQSFEDLERKVNLLKVQLLKARQENEELGNKCRALERENSDLKACARSAGQIQPRSRWTEADEIEWQRSRQVRLEDQKLVQSSLLDHLEQVNTTYDIKNQWCISQKPHFGLHFPRSFQRAHDLNARDKANKENELDRSRPGLRAREAGNMGSPARALRLFV